MPVDEEILERLFARGGTDGLDDDGRGWVMEHGSRLLWTNGRAIVDVPVETTGIVAEIRGPSTTFATVVERIEDRPRRRLGFASVLDVLRVCRGTGVSMCTDCYGAVRTCADCAGSGWVERDENGVPWPSPDPEDVERYDDDDADDDDGGDAGEDESEECDACKGRGEMPCQRCGVVEGEWPRSVICLGARCLDPALVACVLLPFSGLVVVETLCFADPTGTDDVAIFRGALPSNDWSVLVMGMRDIGKPQEELRVHTTAFAAFLDELGEESFGRRQDPGLALQSSAWRAVRSS